MIRKTFFLVTLIACLLCAYGQDLNVILYKGNATISGTKLNVKIAYALTKDKILKLDPNTLIFVYSSSAKKYMDISTALQQSMTHKQLYDKLLSAGKAPVYNNTTGGNSLSRFLNFIKEYHKEVEQQDELVGTTYGGSEGLGRNYTVKSVDGDIFEPGDTSILLTDTIHLAWQLRSKLANAKLVVIHKTTGDTVYFESTGANNFANVKVEKEGEYLWYLNSKIEGKTKGYNIFIKPDSLKRKQVYNELEEFKKQISMLSSELQTIMIEDFLTANCIIIE